MSAGGPHDNSPPRQAPRDFKTERQRDEWNSGNLARFCRFVFNDAALFAFDHLGWSFLITEIYRTPFEDQALDGTGVHPAWRAIDVRTRDQKLIDIDRIVAYVNGRYVYDPRRPAMVCAYARPHGTGPHLHLQTHPGSTFRSTPRLA